MKLSNSRGSGRAARVWGVLLACNAVALAQQYTISTAAGGVPPSTPTGALNISIGPPQRVAVDAAGNYYFSSSNAVFKVDGSGTLTLLAGNGRPGFSGDGGPAPQAQLNAPQGIAVDAAGDLFIADSGNNRIRKVTPDGIIHTIAGQGTGGFFGNEGPATQAMIHAPGGVAVNGSGNLYIADTGNHDVRLVTPDGIIHQFAGNSYAGFLADGGPATGTNLFAPEDVAVGPNNVIYIADTGNSRIRTVDQNGIIQTVAGNGTIGIAGDSGAATSASLAIPYAVTVDSSGNFYIADFGNDRIRMVNSKGTIVTVVGSGLYGFAGDGAAATQAKMYLPSGVAVDGSGNVYIADQWNLRIRKLASGNISTVAGNGMLSYSGDGGPATRAQLNGPQGTAVDSAGNLFISDTRNGVVRKVSGGTISTVSGTSLVYPRGMAADLNGNVFVADSVDNKVKRIGPDGTVAVVAGNGTSGYGGDGGAATSAMLHSPLGVAVDRAGNLYIADFGNNVIREVSAAGTIATVAGNLTQGYAGDGAAAAQASLNGPGGVAVDASGNLYIADTNNHAIREVTGDGVIRTIAGTGVAGYTGDGGPATQAQIISPIGIVVDGSGNVYISDAAMRIRKFLPGGSITTIAGDGNSGYFGDNGAATLAALNRPAGLALDSSGNLYIADAGNNAIRRLQPAAASITLSAVTHAATNRTGPVAPGEIVVLYGSGIGPAQLTINQPSNGVWSTSLAGTTVVIGGIAAPILYTSPNQVGAVVPFGISGSSVTVVVQNQGQTTAAQTLAVAAAAPGVFTLNYSGTGPAVAFNQNGQLNSSLNPAARGSQLTLYVTGLGQTSPAGTDGLLGTAPLPAAGQTVTATFGGQPATVLSATGVAGQVAGMMQVTVQVPAGITPGSAVAVGLQAGNASAPSGVTVAVGP